ncbi:hypothetical protein [Streptococcus halichoeri]|uniref:hypothetical protein n=1 Tax=Streptococcus halichoeri TaxID=254785 RepID=UPI001356B3E6|nr:hypothetical protein [Streptococcus halichoeri]
MKQFRKKAITSLAVASLAGIFCLAQSTNISAETTSETTHPTIQQVKDLKEQLEKKLQDPSKKYDTIDKLETEFIFNHKGNGIFWHEGWNLSHEGTTYVTYELEDSFTTEIFKTKFKKTEEEAKKLVDEYLQKLYKVYKEKLDENKN